MSLPFTQVCYVVKDYKETIAGWVEHAGAGPFYAMGSDQIPKRIYRGQPAKDQYIAAIGFLGTTLLEIIQPIDNEPSVFQEVLRQKGESIHHIYPRMRPTTRQQYDEQGARWIKAGYEFVAEFDILGIGRAGYFDARKKFGIFLEIAELEPNVCDLLTKMYETHLSWDGKRVIRDFFDAELTAASAA